MQAALDVNPATRPNAAAAATGPAIDVAQARPRTPWGRWAANALVALLAVQALVFLATNPRLEWAVVAEHLTGPAVLSGLGVSVLLTAVSMSLGTLIGTVLALMKLSGFATARAVAGFYTWLFRGTPLLIQLLAWYNLAYLVPRLSIGLPFGPEWASWDTNEVITPFVAAVLGLALNEAAYMAEIMRAGILSVDPGQRDAARALGFTPARTFRRIVFPQAMRIVLPPAGSQVIGMLKGTSLVSVIAMTDLLFSVQTIYNRNFKVVPLLLVAVVWYLVVFSGLSLVQRRLEAHFGRGHQAAATAARTR
ncbi:amino acid ABC transporter permease [Ideonella sp. DXS22W]|uniref:Amino acid ABC transporter permease n=1 Tax=Pseudaquabacterium inlustre TaxID=2984192 RepID=A0ABU9CLN7_9BURK